MEIKIVYEENVLHFLDSLLFLLFEKNYFNYVENAYVYVENIVAYVERNIGIVSNRETPFALKEYGDFYITYEANKNTTWYILFFKQNDKYLISHILNNHTEMASYFNLE